VHTRCSSNHALHDALEYDERRWGRRSRATRSGTLAQGRPRPGSDALAQGRPGSGARADLLELDGRRCAGAGRSLGHTSHIGPAPGQSLGQTSSEQSDQERRTGETRRPGAEHGRICEEDDWRGGRAAATKEQRQRDQEGRGATSQELDPGTRRGGASRSRGRRAQRPKEERAALEGAFCYLEELTFLEVVRPLHQNDIIFY
jgi:hypothetical protein